MRQQQVCRFESHGLNVLLESDTTSTHLRSCWRRTFWAHTVIKMMWCDTCDFFGVTVTASHAICYHSVNHSNIHLIIVLTAPSDPSNFPR